VIVAGAFIGLIALAVCRIWLGGFDAMGSDQGRYVYSGLAMLDSRGFATEGGDPFLFRSPAYPLVLATAYRVGGEPAADIVAWLIGLVGLTVGVWQAGRLGGAIAAAATAALFASVPIVWEQSASLGVDLPGTAVFLAALPLLWRARVANWVAAGLVLALAILVKETVAPVAIVLPLAWLPVWSRLSWRRWAGLTAAFAVTISQAVSWWWLYVWFQTGRFFPLNSLDAIVTDAEDVAGPAPSIRPLLVIGAATVSGLLLLRFRGGDPRVRVLIAAMLGTSPAAIVAYTAGQPTRNVLPLLAVTSIVGAVLVAEVVRRVAGTRRTVLLATLAAIAVVGVGLGQSAVNPPVHDSLPREAAAFVEPNLAAGDAIVSSLRDRTVLGVALFDNHVLVRAIPTRPVNPQVPADSYLWLGLRRGTLFGITRHDWTTVVGGPGVRYLIVAQPHPLSPTELLAVLGTDIGRRNGLRPVRQLEDANGSVQIYEVDATDVASPPAIRLHARPEALIAWIRSVTEAGRPDAVAELLRATPVTPRQAGMAELFRLMGPNVCFRPIREGAERRIRVEARQDQKRCLSAEEVGS
jgi:hypothetical protein